MTLGYMTTIKVDCVEWCQEGYLTTPGYVTTVRLN